MDQLNQSTNQKTNESEVASSSRSKSQKAIYSIVIAAMMLSVSIVIKEITEFIPFLNMPRGGSISLVMVPLVLVGLYCGPIYGFSIPILFSLYNFFRDGVTSWTPNTGAILLSLFLDYIVAFGIIGISSFFRKAFFEKKSWAAIAALAISCVLRFISHFFSGIIVFNNIYDYKGPVTPDWTTAGVTFSTIYNGSYMLPTMLLGVIVLALLTKPLFATMNMRVVKTLAPKNLKVEENESYKDSLTSGINLAEILCVASDLLVSVLALVPAMRFGLVAFATMGLSVIMIIVESYLLAQDIKKKDKKQMIFDITIIALSVVALALSIVAITSVYTEFYDIYFPVKE